MNRSFTLDVSEGIMTLVSQTTHSAYIPVTSQELEGVPDDTAARWIEARIDYMMSTDSASMKFYSELTPGERRRLAVQLLGIVRSAA